MTDNGTGVPAIPLGQWPSPACHVSMPSDRDGESDDRLIFETANSSFKSEFGSFTAGEPIDEMLRAVGIDVDDLPSDISEFIARDDRRLVQSSKPSEGDSGTETYIIQGFTTDDLPGGYVVLTPLPSNASRGQSSSSEIGIEDVTSVISHDLRNPLDVAKARLRAGRELNEDEHFEHVAQAHDRMERIIDDVLTLADNGNIGEVDSASAAHIDRQDSSKAEHAVDIGHVAEAAWNTVETEDATLRIISEFPSTVADEDRLQRLFENLFRNAVEHGSTSSPSQTHQGAQGSGITVTVGPLDGDPPDGFYVADDGRGIPGDERDQVFDPGVSSTGHGTGLGLAIVDRIASRHGWSITVTAAADGGARFEVNGVEFATNP